MRTTGMRAWGHACMRACMHAFTFGIHAEHGWVRSIPPFKNQDSAITSQTLTWNISSTSQMIEKINQDAFIYYYYQLLFMLLSYVEFIIMSALKRMKNRHLNLHENVTTNMFSPTSYGHAKNWIESFLHVETSSAYILIGLTTEFDICRQKLLPGKFKSNI